MKIGIDIRSLMDQNRSGVGEYTYNMLENIFQLDRDNQYFLFYNSFVDIKADLPDWNYPNVRFVASRWPNKVFNFCQKFLKYPKLDNLCGGVDVFWLPNWHFAALSEKCKTIVTIHDLSYTRYPEFLSFRRRLWHFFLNIPKLLKQTDKIIAVSKSTQNDLVELFGIEKNKVAQIYSGVKAVSQISNDNIEKVKIKFKIKKDYIFSIGTLEPRKNVEGIILAYNKLRKDNPRLDVELVIAGGKGWRYKGIYRLAKESEFSSQIKFINFISVTEKEILYSSAQVFVYPSFYEGFGIPPLEAMSCGCPVITSLNSSLSEIVGDAGLLVDVYNLADLSMAMKQILVDKKLKERLVENGLKRVKDFDWKKSAMEFIELNNWK